MILKVLMSQNGYSNNWFYKDKVDNLKVIALECGAVTSMDTKFTSPDCDILFVHTPKSKEKTVVNRCTYKLIEALNEDGKIFSIVTNGIGYLLSDEGKTIEKI